MYAFVRPLLSQRRAWEMRGSVALTGQLLEPGELQTAAGCHHRLDRWLRKAPRVGACRPCPHRPSGAATRQPLALVLVPLRHELAHDDERITRPRLPDREVLLVQNGW